jgi:hypothetical protein
MVLTEIQHEDPTDENPNTYVDEVQLAEGTEGQDPKHPLLHHLQHSGGCDDDHDAEKEDEGQALDDIPGEKNEATKATSINADHGDAVASGGYSCR